MSIRLAALTLLLICCAMPATAQDAPPPPNRVTSKEMGERVINRVAPIYPPLARQARIQGTVMLREVINKSGDVQSVQLISGHPMLAPAAIAAVKQWKYSPYLLNGEAVEVETTVQVNFTMPDKPADGGTGSDQSGAFINSPGVRISEVVMRALRTERVDAVYPPEAEQARIEGQVVLNVRLNKYGEIANISLISGHPMFVRTAIEAVKQWRYKPYLVNDEPVEVETMVRLTFSPPSEQSAHGVVADTPMEADLPPGAVHPAQPGRVRVAAGVEQGLLIRRVQPLYPPDAREQHIQGTVILLAIISKEGNIDYVQLISGHPDLAAAAIDAVKQWQYRPYLLNGSPVKVETQIQVNFTLTE